MNNYEQIRLLAGLNHVVYANGGTVVSPNTDVYLKLQVNNRYIYLPLGKLNQIGRPGTDKIIHVQSRQIMGTVDELANQLYVLNTLPSVPPLPAEEPEPASPSQPGGSHRSTKRHRRRHRRRHRNRSTKKYK